MRLDDEVLRGFDLGKAHKFLTAPLNSLSFHRSADLLLASTDDDELHVISASTGEPRLPAPVPCKKYGARCAVWTHTERDVLHASAKGESDAIRYLNVESVRYNMYFEGHAARVTSIDMSPLNDTFLSAGMDRTVRLWDLRMPTCLAVLQAPSQAVAAFDQQGTVFAVGADNGVIKLFDAAACNKGPFETFVVPALSSSPAPFRQLLFSNDGNLLVAVAGATAFVLHAFEGDVKHALQLGPAPDSAQAMQGQVSLSFDGNYLIGPCDASGSIGVWSTASGQQVATWRAASADATPRCVAWAPRRLLAAAGNMCLGLWVPSAAAAERAVALGPAQQAAGAAG